MLPNHLHLKEVSVVLGVVIFLLSTVNSAVPRIGSCPILTGRLPVPLPALVKAIDEINPISKSSSQYKSNLDLKIVLSFVSKIFISNYKSPQSSQVHCFLPV